MMRRNWLNEDLEEGQFMQRNSSCKIFVMGMFKQKKVGQYGEGRRGSGGEDEVREIVRRFDYIWFGSYVDQILF